MGYKSAIRSMSAAANAAQREAERRRKAEMRLNERLSKKVAKIEEKIEKIVDALQDELAKGKIDQKRYDELLVRKEDITLELIVFGSTPAVSLAKRYITGKIDLEEFEELKTTIMPPEVLEEKEYLVKQLLDQANQLEKIVKKSKKKRDDCCQNCEKPKGFFSPLSEIDAMLLCGKCKRLVKKLKEFKGLEGQYFDLSPMEIKIDDLDNLSPTLSIRNECLL